MTTGGGDGASLLSKVQSIAMARGVAAEQACVSMGVGTPEILLNEMALQQGHGVSRG